MKKDSIGRLISYISRVNQKRLVKVLKQHDIGGGGQHAFLKKILQQPGVNQDQLTSYLKFDKATTARSVSQLEQAGYIERQVDEADRRSYRLYPTQKAIEFEPTLLEILDEANEILTECLSEQEEEQLIQLLRKVSLHQRD